jgi:hypothetical protein
MDDLYTQWPLRQKNNVISVYRPDDTLQSQQSPPECIKNLVKKSVCIKIWQFTN